MSHTQEKLCQSQDTHRRRLRDVEEDVILTTLQNTAWRHKDTVAVVLISQL